MAVMWDEYRPGDYIRGWIGVCHGCRRWFVGRPDAKVCSQRCKQRLWRAKKEEVGEMSAVPER